MADYKYTPADFKSDQLVKWCPGCGDHAILNAVQRAMPEVADALNIPHNKFTFVSGIGCSSRFIYYMKTFGFHTIHGRANAVATGIKVANPDLSVWVCSGDGDSLAIGGNHFIHAIRRNIDLNMILFNNEIYGLTKGQYSPTTKLGKITKTSPYGTIEKPFTPGELVIGAKGTFFARTIDAEVPEAPDFFERLREGARRLFEAHGIENLLVTLSEHGMVFVSAQDPDKLFHIPTEAREVFDVSGAGDTSLAAFGHPSPPGPTYAMP